MLVRLFKMPAPGAAQGLRNGVSGLFIQRKSLRNQCVIPAQAGIHLAFDFPKALWIPACAGMTECYVAGISKVLYLKIKLPANGNRRFFVRLRRLARR